ncbi:MAG: SprT family zinc-dependent metalloprotease [Caldimonas sp.]
MSGRLVRGLRRIVDVLQRGLFDEEAPAAVASPVARATPAPPAAFTAPDATVAGAAIRHPRANREVALQGRRIGFLLKRTRRRSIGFVVGVEGLVVSAPKWVALRDIDAAVREKGRWILARLAEQRERLVRVDAARVVWRDGAEIQYLGQPVRVVLDARHGVASGEVSLDAALDAAATDVSTRRLLVGLPVDASAERLRDAVQSWLQREARAVFETRCAHYAERLGVSVTRLTLSSAATRWGSASASGAVRLHWRLIHFPLATIDYVVAHELAHLREMNHSPRFWNVVRSVVPEYGSAKAQLNREALATWD